MKKAICALLAFLSLFLLVACGADSKADVSNRKEVILSVDKSDFTKGQFYDAMVGSYADSIIINKLRDMIYAKEISEDMSDIEERADKTVEDFKEAVGDLIDLYLNAYGFNSIEEYREELVSSLKTDKIVRHYCDEKMSDLLSAHKPVKARIIQCDSLEKAQEALKVFQSGENIDQAYTDFGTTAFTSQPVIVLSDDSAVDATLVAVISAQKENGVLPAVTADANEKYFYVAEIIDTDTSAFTDEFVDKLISSSKVSEDTALGFYAKKGGFRIYDEDIYNTFASKHKAYLSD